MFVLAFVLSVSRVPQVLGINNAGVQNRIEQQNAIREKKEELRTIREQKQEEFKQKLQGIKDAHKQKIVDNLDRSYANINNRWTTHFKNVLERLTKILDKVKIRAEKQKNAEALASINGVYGQIEQAKTAVEEQAAKIYTIEITGEDKLGEAAKAVHFQLRNDLQALREQIKDIRESIREVILTL